MLSFDVNDISKKEQYKLMIGTVIPRPVALVLSLNENKTVNIAPFSYFNMVSYNPPVLMVSIQRKDGVMKDTTRNILRSKEAVIHSVDYDNLDDVNLTSSELESNQSELELTKFNLVPSQSIETPGIIEMPVRYETNLYEHHKIKSEDKSETVADVFFMKVKYFHILESIYDNSYILADQLNPISRLAGHDYMKLGEIITLERPDMEDK